MLLATLLAAQPVPLRIWASSNGSQRFGPAYGLAVGDYDGDGWTDVYNNYSGQLWHNEQGRGWLATTNLNAGGVILRYSASFADFDADGRTDIACEPYRVGCLRVFHNRPSGFVDIAANVQQFPERACAVSSETISWGDVDGDGLLDMFLPTYQGNYLYLNQGPGAPGGAYLFRDVADRANVRRFTGPRPEGTMMGDIDGDGDLEIYSNGVLYQNVSSPGFPSFRPLSEAASGIGNSGQLDEGALMADMDLDGDLDVVLAHPFLASTNVWLNRGDGSFARGPVLPNRVNEGLSAEDWDLDGDLDITSDANMFRNQLVESRTLGFVAATSSVPIGELAQLAPCWFDWDRDGDLDCVGRWNGDPLLLENTLYSATTQPLQRRYLRVRVAREALGLPRGVDVEYGATVTVRVTEPRESFVRTKLVASAAGYVSQSDYVLTFGLEGSTPFEDLRCDLSVDFPNHEKGGRWRVDRDVNPALGDLRPALLRDREITVFRGGSVLVDGCTSPPTPGRTPNLFLTPTLPTPTTTPLAAPVGVPVDTHVGLRFTAVRGVRLREIVVDGTLAPAVTCAGSTFNVALFDAGSAPRLLATWDLRTPAGNHRGSWPCDVVLAAGAYQLQARVAQVRASPLVAAEHGLVRIDGGLLFASTSPCAFQPSLVVPTHAGMAIGVGPDDAVTFADLGHGLAGSNGVPRLQAAGNLAFAAPITLSLRAARANAPTVLVAGQQAVCWPLFGGTLVPEPTVLANALTDARGDSSFTFPWRLARGRPVHFQHWVLDPGALRGVAASNALRGVR
ncbi:MAG: CRTAC1 family protein [Planctomycetota bacterium]